MKLIIYSILGMLLIATSCKKHDEASDDKDAQQSSPTTITFIVKNQNTDFAVSGATITAKAPDGTVSTLKVGEDGKASFTAVNGNYTFAINASGYSPMETNFSSGGEAAIEAGINLDPIAGNTVSSTPAVGNNTQITGYVKDADKNSPLSGVQVNAGGYSGTTDGNGFFSIEVPAQALVDGKTPQTISIRSSKGGYSDFTINNFHLIPETCILKIALSSLTSTNIQGKSQQEIKATQQVELIHGLFDRTDAVNQQRYADVPAISGSAAAKKEVWKVSATVPTSIKVGTNCPDNNCTSCFGTVQVLSLEAYVQSGLDEEWISGWGAESLKAGAIAYRSYGAYYKLHPYSSTYDIKSNTCHQAWGSDVYTSTKNAAIATAGQVLIRNGAIFRSEYSAETNNEGCGNGYSGTGGSFPSGWPCISDAVCSGSTSAGHGRGMCQWGSSRWATSGKTYQWILSHYYSVEGVTVQGATPVDPAPPGTFDDFNSGVGHFYSQPTATITTVGVSTTSTAVWFEDIDLRVTMNDDASVTTPWKVRLLSGSGNPVNNVPLPKTGKVWFWAITSSAQPGATVRLFLDDSDGTEKTPSLLVGPAGVWTKYEWDLATIAVTQAFDGLGTDQALTAANVTLDAIVMEQPNTSTIWKFYIDDVGKN